MVMLDEFIWTTDHYVCHIIEEKHMLSIARRGLIPMNGERCKSVSDDKKAIFFLDGLCNVESWARALFEEKDLESLKVLRFNLKRRKWFLDSINEKSVQGYYLLNKVLSERISFLEIMDANGIVCPVTKLFDLGFSQINTSIFDRFPNYKDAFYEGYKLVWKPIGDYR